MAGSEDQIRAANARFVETFNRGDHAGAARGVYTRNARVLPPDAPLIQGRDAAAQFWQEGAKQLGMKSVSLSTVSLDVSDGGACEIGDADLTLQSGQVARFKYVVLWKQEDDQWRWDVDIWNGRP